MNKKILIFSGAEVIGDGIIKLPFLALIKKRLPDYRIYWITNNGTTVYKNELKNYANIYIDEIYEKAELSYLPWRPISKKFSLDNISFDIIIDTQKTIARTLALKRIKCEKFISSSANWFFSSKAPKNKKKNKTYYLKNLIEMLDLISDSSIKINYENNAPEKLLSLIKNELNTDKKYIGYAPGAGGIQKIWDLKNFLKVANYFLKKNYIPVFFLGPNERNYQKIIKKNLDKVIFIEEMITEFSKIEIVMASSNFLSCSLTNDSGTSHMLANTKSPQVKLFGPTNKDKFSNPEFKIKAIDSKDFGSSNINSIKTDHVIKTIEGLLNVKT